MSKLMPNVDVVICIHNALEDVKNCISSVIETDYQAAGVNIILVDDGSDKPTADYLREISAQTKNCKLIRRENAGGYTVAANTGLKASSSPFCALLNSDTIVPKIWLQKIISLFLKYEDVGIIGPLSNAASWQSVPALSNPKGGWAINELPKGWTVDDMDAFVEKKYATVNVDPRVPLLNGFCYVVRAKVYETIGFLDERGFPRGFGEEDDFSMRSENAGFGLMLALNTYVFHAKSKSYGSQKRNELSKKGALKLVEKHSEARIKRSVENMKKNPYLRQIRESVSKELDDLS